HAVGSPAILRLARRDANADCDDGQAAAADDVQHRQDHAGRAHAKLVQLRPEARGALSGLVRYHDGWRLAQRQEVAAGHARWLPGAAAECRRLAGSVCLSNVKRRLQKRSQSTMSCSTSSCKAIASRSTTASPLAPT